MFKLQNEIKLQKILKIYCTSKFQNFQKFIAHKYSNVFDKELYKFNKDFASRYRDSQEFHYLYNINLMNLLNSMFVMRKNFDTIVFMGMNPETFLEKIPQNIHPKTFIYCDISEENLKISKTKIDLIRKNFPQKNNSTPLPQNIFPLLINQDKWPFKDNSINCIINNLLLHNVENLDDYLKLINNSLVPDGCLLANFFCNETFNELRFVMNLAENEREGGVSQNVLSFLPISDMGNILHKLKFTLPSFNVNKYRYKFSDLSHLFEFLKIIGETNFLKNRRHFKKKDTYISAMALYHSLFNRSRITSESDEFLDYRIIDVDFRKIDSLKNVKNISKEQGNKDLVDKNIESNDSLVQNSEKTSENESYSIDDDYVYATVDIATFIAWKFHSTQQKPKDRGSGEFSLKELATNVLEEDKENEIRFGKIELKKGVGNEDEYEIVELTEIIKDKIKKKLGNEVVDEKLKNAKINTDEGNENINNKK